MKLFKKKRTIDVDLACLFHEQFDPAWLTEENADRIPTCTTCNLSLVPASYKQVLVTGEVPPNLKLTEAAALTAACSALMTLWAHINLGGSPIGVSMQAVDDVWAPEAYEEWPNISQEALLATIGDGLTLGSQEFGSWSDQLPYLASVAMNLQWHLEDKPEGVTVHLWPKDSMAVLSSSNYEAFQQYLALARKALPGQQIWVLIAKLSAQIDKERDRYLAHSLVGVEVTLHSLIESELKQEWELEEASRNSSSEALNIEPGAVIDPLGPDNPKRLYLKYSPGVEMVGPFDLEAEVHSSDWDEFDIELIHQYRFKLLVRAASAAEALATAKTRFYQKFGLTIMGRDGQNWRAGDETGIDWDEYASVHDHWLYSKVVDVTLIPTDELGETAWRSRCI